MRRVMRIGSEQEQTISRVRNPAVKDKVMACALENYGKFVLSDGI